MLYASGTWLVLPGRIAVPGRSTWKCSMFGITHRATRAPGMQYITPHDGVEVAHGVATVDRMGAHDSAARLPDRRAGRGPTARGAAGGPGSAGRQRQPGHRADRPSRAAQRHRG